jgi:hypothetical protein
MDLGKHAIGAGQKGALLYSPGRGQDRKKLKTENTENTEKSEENHRSETGHYQGGKKSGREPPLSKGVTQKGGLAILSPLDTLLLCRSLERLRSIF